MTSAHPLIEKATLFWHGHFATGSKKVGKLDLMWAQNELLRRHALGSFPTLLREIGKDGAFGGFDEHANEKRGHDRLMSEFDQAVTAFQQDLEAHGLGDQVLKFVHSKFGRRAQENASGGTDHGAAGPTLLIGTQVKGGLYGDHPSLTDLQDGDLRMGIDFLSVYATLLDRWLARVDEVLGQRFERLAVLKG